MVALQTGEALGLSGQCSFCLCSCTITGSSCFCRAAWRLQSGLVCTAGPITAGFSLPTHEPFLGPRQLGFLCPSHTRGMGVSGRPQSPSTVWLGRPLHTQILGLPSTVPCLPPAAQILEGGSNPSRQTFPLSALRAPWRLFFQHPSPVFASKRPQVVLGAFRDRWGVVGVETTDRTDITSLCSSGSPPASASPVPTGLSGNNAGDQKKKRQTEGDEMFLFSGLLLRKVQGTRMLYTDSLE